MRFTTRVELHRATEFNYEQLHSAMERSGFSRTIASNDGRTYHLPTAEYNYDGSADRDQILEQAKTAASTTGLRYSILVTESNGRTWHNLSAVS